MLIKQKNSKYAFICKIELQDYYKYKTHLFRIFLFL
jgi:hypothetical protein